MVWDNGIQLSIFNCDIIQFSCLSWRIYIYRSREVSPWRTLLRCQPILLPYTMQALFIAVAFVMLLSYLWIQGDPQRRVGEIEGMNAHTILERPVELHTFLRVQQRWVQLYNLSLQMQTHSKHTRSESFEPRLGQLLKVSSVSSDRQLQSLPMLVWYNAHIQAW